MLDGVFRSGINRNNAAFKGIESFPFEIDKLQKSIRSFTVTKVYDSALNRWKNDEDFRNERDMAPKE